MFILFVCSLWCGANVSERRNASVNNFCVCQGNISIVISYIYVVRLAMCVWIVQEYSNGGSF